MELLDWAEKEIEMACKHIRNESLEDTEWDYGVACYESALKAFKILLEDRHSGMSIQFTKVILNRLIDGKPLTPIEDTSDVWNEVGHNLYQCKRMSSLFKDIDEDGFVTYHDNNRFVCINERGDTCHSVLVSRIMEEMYPIKMPYYPSSKPYMIYYEYFLVDSKNGDFDTVGILYMKNPEGDKASINRFFTEGVNLYGSWKEITKEEYDERRSRRIKVQEKETLK